MSVPCPFCKKKINFTARKCPYCTSQLEGIREWEQLRMVYSVIYIVGVVAAVIFVIYITFRGSPQKPSEDVELETLLDSMKTGDLYSYTFDNNTPQARVMKKALEHSKTPCNITGGKLYPFKSRQGFDADVYCDDGTSHTINYNAARDSNRLYIDGEKVSPPSGW